MNGMNLSENIIRLRRKRKLTQEQLADFVGVTKAAVSKWETAQSIPDILLLPRLASLFDVTVDELIGYRPQLSREQCRKLYQEFAADFVSRPFGEVMEKTRDYVKRYYSCYPFLAQVCGVWVNHVGMAGSREEQAGVLSEVCRLCGHIRENCRDVAICSEVLGLYSFALLQLGKAQEVVEALGEAARPYQFRDSVLLTQAYMMLGREEAALGYLQACMHGSLLALVSDAAVYLSLQGKDPEGGRETIRRVEQLAGAYDLEKLNPNSGAVFEYQAMLCFLRQGNKEEAVAHGEKYVSCISELLSGEEILLHGDGYFDRVDRWIEELGTGPGAPRSRQAVLEDVRKTFDGPEFAVLEGDQKFERLKKRLKEMR